MEFTTYTEDAEEDYSNCEIIAWWPMAYDETDEDYVYTAINAEPIRLRVEVTEQYIKLFDITDCGEPVLLDAGLYYQYAPSYFLADEGILLLENDGTCDKVIVRDITIRSLD